MTKKISARQHEMSTSKQARILPQFMRKSVYIREGLVGRIYIYIYLARMLCFHGMDKLCEKKSDK